MEHISIVIIIFLYPEKCGNWDVINGGLRARGRRCDALPEEQIFVALTMYFKRRPPEQTKTGITLRDEFTMIDKGQRRKPW
jgi:hypothetical protein